MRGNSNEQSNRGFSCGMARLLSILLAAAAQLAFVASVFGQAPASHGSTQADQMQRIAIVFARELRDMPPPFSLVDMRPPDDGVAGARLAINDNNTTGRFLKQAFTLEVVESRKAEELVTGVTKRAEAGVSLIVADAGPQTVIALADALKGGPR